MNLTMLNFLSTEQFVRKIGSKALQCSVFQYLLGLLKSEEISRSSVSKIRVHDVNIQFSDAYTGSHSRTDKTFT